MLNVIMLSVVMLSVIATLKVKNLPEQEEAESKNAIIYGRTFSLSNFTGLFK